MTRSLLQLQRTFAARLLEGQVKGTSLNSLRIDAHGFQVHANNARVSLRIAVENAYPVTRRIVGDDFFTVQILWRSIDPLQIWATWLTSHGSNGRVCALRTLRTLRVST